MHNDDTSPTSNTYINVGEVLIADELNRRALQFLEDDDTKKCVELANQAKELSYICSYVLGQAKANHTLALVYRNKNNPLSLQHSLESYKLFLQTDDLNSRCLVLKTIGHTYLDLGDFVLAEENLLELSSLSELAHQNFYIESLSLLAGVYFYTGRYISSELTLKKVLSNYEGIGDLVGEVKTKINIGALFTSTGRYPEALEYLISSYNSVYYKTADTRAKITVLNNIGHAYIQLGDSINAQIYFSEALVYARASLDRNAEANILLNISTIKEKIGLLDEAEKLYRETLVVSRESQYRQGEVSSLDGLGNLLIQRGEFSLGIETLREALLLAQNLDDLEGQLDILSHMGRAFAQRKVWSEALETLNHVLELANFVGHPKAVTEAHKSLYDVYKGMGDLEKALYHHELLYSTERALMSEESEKRVQELSARFNLERSQQEAQLERLLRETAEEARNRALEQVQQRTQELEQAQLEVVNRLAVAAEYRDDLTGEHTRRVGRYSALIAEKLGLDGQTVTTLETAARLHDVGKIGIPDDILHKPGKLLPEEFEFMKSHTRMGARILSGGQSLLLRMAEEISLTHHERWDGTGYPERLVGEAIPLLGRIVAVADVFDALTHERPYKRAWTPQEALSELERSSGAHFDPAVVQVALEVLREIPG